MPDLRQSTAVTIKLGPFVDDTDATPPATGLTISQADIRLSKNGGAFAQTNNATGATHDENGWYGIPLDTTDTNTLGSLIVSVYESGYMVAWKEYMVMPANVWDSLYGADKLQVDTTQVEGADATDTIQSSCNAALVAQKLDHLVAVADADDVVNDSIIAKLASKSATADWSTFDNETDSLEAIRDNIVASAPQAHAATANNETTGTLISGDYTDTVSDNDTDYYITAPAGAAVGGFGLNVDLTFSIGTGRIAEAVTVNGNFNAGAVRAVEVWAYDYILASYVQLSNGSTNFQNSVSETTQTYAMTENMRQVSDGEVKIRFTSTSTTTGDRWNLDYISTSSVAQEAAGLTADAIQQAVWARSESGHDENTLGYNLSQVHLVHGDIVSATDATRFVIDFDIPADDIYNGMVITLEDKTDDHREIRRIVDTIASSDEIIVDRALGFTPVAGDDYYIMNAAYADANVTHIEGSGATDTIASAPWDELLTAGTHNIPTSAGRRLREIASNIIVTGTSPDTGGTANTATRIELDGDASSTDGAYDPGTVCIVNGTGAGQSRQIFEYDGTNKYAYINRDWKIIPDDTSEYIIMASYGDTHVNEGVAQAGGAATITLNALASSTNNVYNYQVVFIVAGTGADQAKVVTGYVGSTKVATVHSNWAIQPDNTSVYAMLPHQACDPATIAAILEDTGTTLPATLAGLNDLSAAEVWSATGTLSITYSNLLQRAYQMVNNKMTINETTGAVALRNIGDSADVATGSVTSNSGTTTRGELSWA